jgi:serine/threonine protein kinase
VTQRESPPLPPGIDEEEEEERTTVGAAPEGVQLSPAPPSPPRLSFAKHNTPTAFTPQAVPAKQGSIEPGPKSQSMPRPGTSTRMGVGSGAPIERGSSGPQPLLSPSAAPQGPGVGMHAPVGMPAPSGMMPYASQTPSAPPRADHSFAGPNATLGLTGPSAMQPVGAPPASIALRADHGAQRDVRSAAFHITRSRAYSFVLDARGQPIELGSGRFAKVYLGEERWLESKTDFRRPVVIKILQKGVGEEDHMRFQMEKELLERVQGHPNVVELFASGENEDPSFLPPSIRDKVDTEFMILEKLEMSLEERLKGSRNRGAKEDLLAYDMRERLFRVLDYMIPIASAVEYAHLVRNICHRDIKPANVLVGLPDPNLRGSTLQVRLADFNVAKLSDEDVQFGMTHMKAAVPGTLFFQSPEQETNVLELLVNVQQGLPEVEYFEDFYIQIAKNDSFSLFNRSEHYPILYADRARKRLVLARPYRELSETNVRARIQKSVGRPADIYSLGATFYYLISGAYANPKTLYDAFHKFIEYERADENNTIEAYLRHEYSVINSLRAPKNQDGTPEVAPADRFFSYKHYLDGNGELIDPNVMLIIAKCMIRNKPDSYCQAHDLETRGISDLVTDLINLYALYGFQPGARPTHLVHRTQAKRSMLKGRVGSRLRLIWLGFLSLFGGNKK